MRLASVSTLIALISLWFLSACTTSKTVMVLRPGRVALPTHVKTFILIDRTETRKDKKRKVENVLEGVLSGEALFADKMSSRYCLEGVRLLADENARITIVNRADIKLKGEGATGLNPVFSESVVDSLCSEYEADGLIVLESFDSDGQSDGAIISNLNYSNMNLRVKTHWRLYDKQSKGVIDEFFMDTPWNNSKSIRRYNPLPPANRAVAEAGFVAGYDYAKQLVPATFKETRTLYTRGCPELKIGTRHAMSDSWEQADQVWTQGLSNNGKTKALKRLTYNLAVAHEIQGDYEKAIEFAQRSAELYGLRKARIYHYFLLDWQLEKQRLDEQLGTGAPD